MRSIPYAYLTVELFPCRMSWGLVCLWETPVLRKELLQFFLFRKWLQGSLLVEYGIQRGGRKMQWAGNLSLLSCVALGKFYSFPKPQFPTLKQSQTR